MKYLYLILSLILVKCNNIPKDDERGLATRPIDSLRKYCSLLEGKFKNDSTGFASGFFVRNKSQLYLVSNFHVFTGWNTIVYDPTRQAIPDVMHLVLLNKATKKVEFYPIELKNINDTAKHRMCWRTPDILFYPLPDSVETKYAIYPMNNLIDRYLEKKNTTPIGVVSTPYFKDFKKNFSYQLTLEGNINSDGDLVRENGVEFVDSFSYNYTPSDFNIPMGGSGSPVFFKYLEINDGMRIEKIAFGGITFARLKPLTPPRLMVERPSTLFLFKEFNDYPH